MRRAALSTDYLGYLMRAATVTGASFGLPFILIVLFFLAFEDEPKRWSLGRGLIASAIAAGGVAAIRVLAEAAGREIKVNAHQATVQYPWPPELRRIHEYEEVRVDRMDGLARVEFSHRGKPVLIVGATMEQAEGLRRHLAAQRKPEVV